MSDNEKKHLEIDSLGEFGLIDKLTKEATLKNPSSLLGVGDDAAEIELSPKESMLVSSDMLVEGVHFNLSYVPLKSLGFKAVSVNVSDIFAMNGKPEQITVSLGVSSKFPVEALEELYKGIHAACSFYNVDLVGGDTVSSSSGLILSISVVGRVAKKKITYRKGAKENDLVVVTGDVGSSYLGLQILEREKGVFLENPDIQPKLEGYDDLIKKQIHPIARQDVIDMFDELDLQRENYNFKTSSSQNDFWDIFLRRNNTVKKFYNENNKEYDLNLTGTGSCIYVIYDEKKELNKILKKIPSNWRLFFCKPLQYSPICYIR